MKRLTTLLSTRNYSFIALSLVVIMVLADTQSVSAHTTEVPAFFLKIAKTIPRMGRSDPEMQFYENLDKDDNSRTKEINTMSKVFKRKIGLYANGGDAWKHFPLTIEGPPELWRTLAGYSSDEHLYKSSNDFNDEMWLRDKRTAEKTESEDI